eukprot:7092604-Alexandrium_andersonii.AAC.1
MARKATSRSWLWPIKSGRQFASFTTGHSSYLMKLGVFTQSRMPSAIWEKGPLKRERRLGAVMWGPVQHNWLLLCSGGGVPR